MLLPGYPAVSFGDVGCNGKWTRIEDVFPINNGDIPASYVSETQRVIQSKPSKKIQGR